MELTRKSNGVMEGCKSAPKGAATVCIGIASIGELLVVFVCGDKDGRHRRIERDDAMRILGDLEDFELP